MSDRPPAVSFVIRRFREDHFRADRLDEHGILVSSTTICVCADQAAYEATRMGQRPLRYDGMLTMVKGEWVPMTTDMTCNVGKRSWLWEHHGFTHRTLRRCPKLVVTDDTCQRHSLSVL